MAKAKYSLWPSIISQATAELLLVLGGQALVRQE
ncbi:hypothetical protein M2387_001769 [Klebsiella sp. BIGb0407]|nr:hypothetical protein [Klebsiella sp. BIGb0407]